MSDINPVDDIEEGGGKRRISRRLSHAIDLLISGKAATQAAAAEQAGLTREHFNRALKEPHVRAFVTRRTSEMLVGLVPKALATLARTLDSGNSQAALNASLVILKQFGVIAPEGGPNVAISLSTPGYVIDLSGGDGSYTRIVGAPDAQQPVQSAGPRTIDLDPLRGGEADGGEDDGGDA